MSQPGAAMSSFSLQVLENAKKVITARPTAGRNRSTPLTEVERELNPHLRKALRIVVDPTAFLDGCDYVHPAGSLRDQVTGMAFLTHMFRVQSSAQDS